MKKFFLDKISLDNVGGWFNTDPVPVDNRYGVKDEIEIRLKNDEEIRRRKIMEMDKKTEEGEKAKARSIRSDETDIGGGPDDENGW